MNGHGCLRNCRSRATESSKENDSVINLMLRRSSKRPRCGCLISDLSCRRGQAFGGLQKQSHFDMGGSPSHICRDDRSWWVSLWLEKGRSYAAKGELSRRVGTTLQDSVQQTAKGVATSRKPSWWSWLCSICVVAARVRSPPRVEKQRLQRSIRNGSSAAVQQHIERRQVPRL